MGQDSCFRTGFFFVLAGVFLLMGCAGARMVDLKLYKAYSQPGPPYSPREKPAKRVINSHESRLQGADSIGWILIQASDRDRVRNTAAREAAKLGADFYSIGVETTGSVRDYKVDRYSYTRGNVIVTETSMRPAGYSTVKQWYCHLYRVNPSPKERKWNISYGFLDCVRSCCARQDELHEACWPSTLKEYVAKGLDPNSLGGSIPLLYRLINCIATPEYIYAWSLTQDYERFRIILDAGADPNLRIKGDISKDLDDYPVLRSYKPPYPSVLRLVRDIIGTRTRDLAKFEQEQKKTKYDEIRVHLDFLKKVEALLVEKGARM
jgi:hypothetical protein